MVVDRARRASRPPWRYRASRSHGKPRSRKSRAAASINWARRLSCRGARLSGLTNLPLFGRLLPHQPFHRTGDTRALRCCSRFAARPSIFGSMPSLRRFALVRGSSGRPSSYWRRPACTSRGGRSGGNSIVVVALRIFDAIALDFVDFALAEADLLKRRARELSAQHQPAGFGSEILELRAYRRTQARNACPADPITEKPMCRDSSSRILLADGLAAADPARSRRASGTARPQRSRRPVAGPPS